ncbi:hypothetical protein OG866_43375 [Streptomyces sp. NBC_00663]|uniref:hypothetical protein n=1 Tax=Streptomyces sp. NBC_00663 TaxID=2975801 RepID=UPI002E3761FF|nr:hypothetical protein [Streptomyces sp. NBC_00663]
MAADGPERTGRLSLTIGHVGSYLGTDGGGKRRFSSIRKAVNGPTTSHLGGASVLDGLGT